MELSDFDGDVEAGSRAGGRELRGAEAGGADPDVDPGVDGADSGFVAAGRGEYCEWVWAGGGQAAGFEFAGEKVAFTGETTTGRLIMQYASQNLIPVTLELGGKSPNIFFEDVANAG